MEPDRILEILDERTIDNIANTLGTRSQEEALHLVFSAIDRRDVQALTGEEISRIADDISRDHPQFRF